MLRHDAALRINSAARPLSSAETQEVQSYRREVRQARLAFRAELNAAGMGGGELERADYLDV